MRCVPLWMVLSIALGWPWIGAVARAGDAFTAASIVPADIDLFIAVDGATEWRQGAGGRLLEMGGTRMFASGDLADAWDGLAASLGLDGNRAFNELLGRRVVFAQRNPPNAGGAPSWVLISLVSRETEVLLRQRLKPAPRRVEKGMSVLSIEDGRFWLATIGDKTSATVMLAPSASSALFEELIGNLGRGADRNLAGSRLGEDLRSIQRGSDALLLRKTRDADGRLIVALLGARRDPRGIGVSLLIRSEAAAERVARVPLSGRRMFDDLSGDAFAAAVQWNVSEVARAIGIEPPALPLPQMLMNFEGRAWLGGRVAYFISPGRGAGVEAALAIESTDVRSLAPAGDRLIAELLRGWWAGPEAIEHDARLLDFEGMYPEAVREVNLSPVGAADRAAGPGGWMDGVRLAWCYPPALKKQPPGGGGWWVIGLSAASARKLTGVLPSASDPEEQVAPWISLGVIRPAAISRALAERQLVVPSPLDAVLDATRGLESVEWSLMRGDGHSIRGDATVTFGPQASKP